ncbi:MAG TPA: hypothetical protein VG456_11725 [Candidatus Sulfopaludibacter sp.]|jgi:hypothetical protein|nr:hypothetical protein [Candidatus Sulfopaludibacter sp.]
MTAEELSDPEVIFNRFRTLLREISRGATLRNSFEPWEMEIMLDLQICDIPSRRRMETLVQYERAVKRQMSSGQGPPMKLSEFLELRRKRRELKKNLG